MKNIILILSLILISGAIAFALLALKFYRQRKVIHAQNQLIESRDKMISSMNRAFNKQLLFIHHSVGDQWLNMAGLRMELMRHGLGVHDATYGDFIGEQTDMNNWHLKFSRDMDKILKFDYHPDFYYDSPLENDIIMFKSCFPNSQIIDEGTAPGNPDDAAKLVWNYKAVLESLKYIFSKYPDKIFIFVTAPPLIQGQTTLENAQRAREFNDWAKNIYHSEYKRDTGLDNLLVFDLFDILADSTNCLKSEYKFKVGDSHPNTTGLAEATRQFVRFLAANNVISDDVVENAIPIAGD